MISISHDTDTRPHARAGTANQLRTALLWLAPALVVYAYLAWHFQFIQDDAYITYRYAQNFLHGDGLVYNIGERVEGYTNFGWLAYLILWGALGLDYILASQITGALLGAGVVVMTWLLALEVFDERVEWMAAAAALLVGCNQSLAYWSPAGLETAGFAFFALLSLYAYVRRSRILVLSIAIATLLRPEGVVIAVTLILISLTLDRPAIRFTLGSALGAAILLLPYLIFKVLYYGSLLPNTFYAKTSFGLDQLRYGIEYTGLFFAHYGFYGAGIVIPLLFWRRLNDAARSLVLFVVLYSLYIVIVGGDVLKVHRFFLPVLAPLAVLILLAATRLAGRMRMPLGPRMLGALLIPLLALTYFPARAHVESYHGREVGLTETMKFRAAGIQSTDSTRFSVALPTIGAFGYELMGHRIIDMLGLTDTTIAHHPEPPLAGLTTTWREQRHNTRYLLEQQPDYILFSTNVKPSAPAEMALFLYPSFLDAYRHTAWFEPADDPTQERLWVAFKKVKPVTGDIQPVYSPGYVMDFKRGIEAQDVGQALRYYDRALASVPRPDNLYLAFQKAVALMEVGQLANGARMLDSIVAEDSLMFEAHMEIYVLARVIDDQPKALVHRRWLRRLVPWLLPHIDARALRMIQQQGR